VGEIGKETVRVSLAKHVNEMHQAGISDNLISAFQRGWLAHAKGIDRNDSPYDKPECTLPLELRAAFKKKWEEGWDKFEPQV